jgi:transposase
MPGKAAKVVITERQLSVLTEIAAARTSEVRMAQRAQIILLAFEKLNNEQISARVGLNEDQVGLWRRRWQGAFPRLVSIECTESRDALRKAVLEVLRDRPRSGRPPRITAEQQAKLASMACECPEDSERPISHWTSRELADEAQQRGIVEAISPQWLRTLLERATLKPFRFKTWLFSPDQADPDFDVRVSTICDAYLNAIDLYNTRGIHTVCIDEQTGIQALERIAPDLLPIPGYAGRREHEYKRHGTIGLFGNFHVPTGQILSPMLRQTRTELDFLENLDNLMSHDRDGQWRLIMDNLNTHNSEGCVRYVAAVCGIEEDLGRKGVSGILKSVKSRARFLEDPSHRIQFIYLPRHSSWLNQVEIWFGILRRKLTRACSVTSLHDLCQKIERFVDYYNATMARPFNWTYTGRLLCA